MRKSRVRDRARQRRRAHSDRRINVLRKKANGMFTRKPKNRLKKNIRHDLETGFFRRTTLASLFGLR